MNKDILGTFLWFMGFMFVATLFYLGATGDLGEIETISDSYSSCVSAYGIDNNSSIEKINLISETCGEIIEYAVSYSNGLEVE